MKKIAQELVDSYAQTIYPGLAKLPPENIRSKLTHFIVRELQTLIYVPDAIEILHGNKDKQKLYKLNIEEVFKEAHNFLKDHIDKIELLIKDPVLADSSMMRFAKTVESYLGHLYAAREIFEQSIAYLTERLEYQEQQGVDEVIKNADVHRVSN